MSALEIDSELVTTENIQLTFANPSPDLQYFLPGDIISSDGAIYRDFVNNTYTSDQTFDGDSTGIDWLSPVADGFDGDTGTQVVGFNTGYSWIYVNMPSPLTVASTDELKIWGSYTSEVRFNKSASAATITEGDMGDGQTGVTVTSALPTSITQIAVRGKGGAAARFAKIEINGEVLLQNGVPAPNPVKVVSVDPDNNKMVVDGGNWLVPEWDQSAPWVSESAFTNLSDPGSLTGLGMYDGVAEGDPGQTADNYIRMTASGTAVLTHTFTNVTELAISASSSKTEATLQFDDGAEQTFIPAANTSYSRIEIANPPSNWAKLTISSKKLDHLRLKDLGEWSCAG